MQRTLSNPTGSSSFKLLKEVQASGGVMRTAVAMKNTVMKIAVHNRQQVGGRAGGRQGRAARAGGRQGREARLRHMHLVGWGLGWGKAHVTCTCLPACPDLWTKALRQHWSSRRQPGWQLGRDASGVVAGEQALAMLGKAHHACGPMRCCAFLNRCPPLPPLPHTHAHAAAGDDP